MPKKSDGTRRVSPDTRRLTQRQAARANAGTPTSRPVRSEAGVSRTETNAKARTPRPVHKRSRKRSDVAKLSGAVVKTDRAAASFVGRADLSRYDLSAMRPVRFEFAPKSARLNMRLPENLLAAVKDAAAETGVPYQRFIRQLLERALADQKRPSTRRTA